MQSNALVSKLQLSLSGKEEQIQKLQVLISRRASLKAEAEQLYNIKLEDMVRTTSPVQESCQHEEEISKLMQTNMQLEARTVALEAELLAAQAHITELSSRNSSSTFSDDLDTNCR